MEVRSKKVRFTEELIAEFRRRLGVSDQTFYRWKGMFGARDIAAGRRHEPLEKENARLKRRVAHLGLEVAILQGVLPKGA